MRPVELRDAGRTLHGTLLQEGRAASGGRAEVFAPGSVEWPSTGVGILLGHRERPEVQAMPSRESDGRIVVQAPATPAIREAVEGGRKWMSVEFHALEERLTKGGVREIQRALVPDAALVADPEYDVTSAEVRRRFGRSMRSRVRTGRRMDCRCPDGCDEIEFAKDAFKNVPDQVLATTGSMDQVIGNARLTTTREGLGIDVALLDVVATRDVATLIGAGIDVYARPLIDVEESDVEEGEERNRGGTLVVRRAVFHAVIVKPVAGGVSGLDPVTLSREGRSRRVETRVTASTSLEAVSGRSRRRIWL